MENTSTLSALISEVSRILNVDTVDPDIGLGELGIDSVNAVELILVCEEIYMDMMNPESLAIDQYTTLRELDRRLLGQEVS